MIIGLHNVLHCFTEHLALLKNIFCLSVLLIEVQGQEGYSCTSCPKSVALLFPRNKTEEISLTPLVRYPRSCKLNF